MEHAEDSGGAPAGTPDALRDALASMPDGPNVEAGPHELEAAEGQLPLEGPRAEQREEDSPAADPDTPT